MSLDRHLFTTHREDIECFGGTGSLGLDAYPGEGGDLASAQAGHPAAADLG
jgi:hypothetical protein